MMQLNAVQRRSHTKRTCAGLQITNHLPTLANSQLGGLALSAVHCSQAKPSQTRSNLPNPLCAPSCVCQTHQHTKMEHTKKPKQWLSDQSGL